MSTLDQLQEILHRDYGIARDALRPDATLETLGLDSLSVLELMFKIEDGFGVKITEDTPTDLVTVGDVVSYIDGLVTRTGAGSTHPAVGVAEAP
jgi:acyl carrier protein